MSVERAKNYLDDIFYLFEKNLGVMEKSDEEFWIKVNALLLAASLELKVEGF